MPFTGRHRRITLFCICIVLAGWTWWDAQVGGYVGLPVNTLGQIVGDLILMGLLAPLAPLARRHRHRNRNNRRDEPAGVRTLLQRVADATHRIQLLDAHVCLPRTEPAEAGQGLGDPAVSRTELGEAVRAALDNDVCVEILLPDPESACCHGIARRLGVEPGSYRRALSLLLDDLDSVSRGAESGRLDLRLYTEPAIVSIVRCDERVWASLDPDGTLATAGYLEVDLDCENGRTLQAYFNRLHAAARIPWHGGKVPAARDPRQPAGTGPSPAVPRYANTQCLPTGPPGPAVLDTGCRLEADALVSLEGSSRW
ncbi:MAG TPA: hypothetical protein VGM10_02670 [Actinocrinis sp.]